MAEVCSLPGEILVEILSRLPKKSQRRFEIVSKEWANLIKEAASRPPKPTEFGFHIVSNRRQSNEIFKYEARFYRRLQDEDNGGLAVEDSISFHSPSQFCAMGSCKGVLFYYKVKKVGNRRITSYHLYNPFMKHHTNLPRLITRLIGGDPVPCAFGVAPQPETNHFKFFVAYNGGRKGLEIAIFHSETREWKTKRAKFAEESYSAYSRFLCMANVHRGTPASDLCFEQTLFWVRPSRYHNLILLFFLKTETFRLLDLPFTDRMMDRALLWESEGRLRCSRFCPIHGLHIWVFRGGVAKSTRSGNWMPIFHISKQTLSSLQLAETIKSSRLRQPPSRIIRVSAFDEHLQMVHLRTDEGLIVCYDIPNKKMTRVVAPNREFDKNFLQLPFSDCKYDLPDLKGTTTDSDLITTTTVKKERKVQRCTGIKRSRIYTSPDPDPATD